MKVFIAGASGVLGRALTRTLLERGHVVVGAVRSEKSAQVVKDLGAQPVVVDVFDVTALTQAMQGADVVVHAATKVPVKLRVGPEDFAENDELRRNGTLALVAAAGRAGAKRYIQQSVVWAVQPPYGEQFDETSVARAKLGPYASALEGEQIADDTAAHYKMQFVVLRCGTFYGPQAGHTQMMRDALLAHRTAMLGGGKKLWSMLHHDDAALAFALACESQTTGTYHVVDNEPVAVATFMTELAQLLKTNKPRSLPLFLARLLLPKSVVDMFARSTDTRNTRFVQAFDFTPRYATYREGLSQTVTQWTKT